MPSLHIENVEPAATALITRGWSLVGPLRGFRSFEYLIRDARAFFTNLEQAEKSLHHTEIGEGYRSYATEYTDSPDNPDLVECFSASHTHRKALSWLPSYLGQRLYQRMQSLQEQLAPLGTNLLCTIFDKLNVPLDRSRLRILDWSRLQVNYGIPATAHRELLHVAHQDSNFLTLAAATAPGLELDDPEHGTVDAWTIGPSSLFALAGGVLTTVTAGQVMTGFHSVRRTRGVHERIAVLYFIDADPRAFGGAGGPTSAEIDAMIAEGWLSSGVPPVRTLQDDDD